MVSIVETIGVSIIMPFIAVATDATIINTNKYFNFIYRLLNVKDTTNFIFIFGIILIIFYLLRALLNLIYFYQLSVFTQFGQSQISSRMFKDFLEMNYRTYIGENSSVLTKSIVGEVDKVTLIIQSIVFISCEVMVLCFIYSLLLFVNLQITLVLTFFLVVSSGVVMLVAVKRIRREGVKREKTQKKFFEILGSTFSNFKLVKLNPNINVIVEKFSSASTEYAKTTIRSSIINQFPRITLELIAFVMIIIVVVIAIWQYKEKISQIIPMLTVFGVGLLRLLPSVNRIINSYNNIVYNLPAINVVYDYLNFPKEELGGDAVVFEKNITLSGVTFSYVENRKILNNVNITINKNDKIAFVGESGSGKSTLIDLLTGLLRPDAGEILIDGVRLGKENIKSLRRQIGYIPQSVYLFEGTVAENVAFESDLNEDKVKEVLKKANLLSWLEEHSDGIETITGEGGIALSGGQRQRIAIARALYNDPSILILDEATSALDNETEEKIMEEIYNIGENKTLIVIAHRLSTIRRCNRVIVVKEGNLVESKIGKD